MTVPALELVPDLALLLSSSRSCTVCRATPSITAGSCLVHPPPVCRTFVFPPSAPDAAMARGDAQIRATPVEDDAW